MKCAKYTGGVNAAIWGAKCTDECYVPTATKGKERVVQNAQTKRSLPDATIEKDQMQDST